MDTPFAVREQVNEQFDKLLEMEIGGDDYWRRRYAGQILAALIAGDTEYRNRIEELYDGLEKFARSMADELVAEMNRTDRGAR